MAKLKYVIYGEMKYRRMPLHFILIVAVFRRDDGSARIAGPNV